MACIKAPSYVPVVNGTLILEVSDTRTEPLDEIARKVNTFLESRFYKTEIHFQNSITNNMFVVKFSDQILEDNILCFLRSLEAIGGFKSCTLFKHDILMRGDWFFSQKCLEKAKKIALIYTENIFSYLKNSKDSVFDFTL